MKKLIIWLVLICCTVIPVSALEFNAPIAPEEAQQYMPEDAESFSEGNDVDFFIFGHYHAEADVPLPKGNRLLLLKDWMSSSPYICFDGTELITSTNI